jgi:hypothetical protein
LDILEEIHGLDQQISSARQTVEDFTPPSAEEEERLSRLETAFTSLVPGEKGMLELAQEISWIASQHGVRSFTLREAEAGQLLPSTGQGAPSPSTPSPVLSQVEGGEQEPGGVSSFLLHLSMQTEYRELAYFLEEISRLPRLLRVESLKVSREFPLIRAEIVLRAFYLPAGGG